MMFHPVYVIMQNILKMGSYFSQVTFSLRFVSRRNGMLFALWCLGEIIIWVNLFPPIYMTNDDFMMNSIASGAITGQPEKMLIFTHVVIGSLLRQLYLWFPSLNWYGIYLLAAFAAGYIAIQSVLFRLRCHLLCQILMHILVLLMLLPALLLLQFTQVAAVVAAGGWMLIIFTSRGKSLWLFFAICLILLSALIRSDVFHLYVIIAVPLLMLNFMCCRNRSVVAVAVMAIILGSAAIAWDRNVYAADEKWSEFRHFNHLRSRITTADTPGATYENLKHRLDEINWSRLDFEIASQFNLEPGIEKFSMENLENLAEAVSHETSLPAAFQQSASLMMKYHSGRAFLPFLFILIFLVLRRRFPQVLSLVVFSLYIFFLAFVIYYLLNGHLKERVLFSLLIPLKLAIVAALPYVWIGMPSAWRNRVVIFLIVPVFAFSLVRAAHPVQKGIRIVKNHPVQASADREICTYMQELDIGLYVSWLDLSTRDVLHLPCNQTQAYYLGWMAGTPWNMQKLQAAGKSQQGVFAPDHIGISWFFRNNYFTQVFEFHQIVSRFYHSLYPDLQVSYLAHPIPGGEIVFELRFSRQIADSGITN
jgi:hypothetical protein